MVIAITNPFLVGITMLIFAIVLVLDFISLLHVQANGKWGKIAKITQSLSICCAAMILGGMLELLKTSWIVFGGSIILLVLALLTFILQKRD